MTQNMMKSLDNTFHSDFPLLATLCLPLASFFKVKQRGEEGGERMEGEGWRGRDRRGGNQRGEKGPGTWWFPSISIASS